MADTGWGPMQAAVRFDAAIHLRKRQECICFARPPFANARQKMLSVITFSCALVAPAPHAAIAVPRAAAPSMALFFRTSTKTDIDRRQAADILDENDKFRPLQYMGSKLRRLKNLVPRKWRGTSASVTDAIVTARLLNQKQARVSGKSTSWEDHLLPSEAAAPRDLADISWEDSLLPAMPAARRNLADISWEETLLPAMQVDAYIAPVTPISPLAISAPPMGKRDLAEGSWEDRLLPGEPAPASAAAPAAHSLAEDSWEDRLLPAEDSPGHFRKTGFTSWEDMLP